MFMLSTTTTANAEANTMAYTKTDGEIQDLTFKLCLSTKSTLQKQVGCFNHRVVTLVADKLKKQWFTLVLKSNSMRQPKGQLSIPKQTTVCLACLQPW